MILTKTIADDSMVERLCTEWSDIHGRLGFQILSTQVTSSKSKWIVPLLADDRTVDRLVFPRTNLVTQLEKTPGECSLVIQKKSGSRFTEVTLVNNMYEQTLKQARAKHLTEKNKRKKEQLMAELQIQPDERMVEQLKIEQKRLVHELKKVKLMIQIANTRDMDVEMSSP